MNKRFGEEKTHALAKYHAMPVMTREAATEIVETLWPGTPPAVKKKAILLCATYNANPLMNHVFILPFKNTKTGTTEHVVVLGIEFTRLMAHRKHNFSYLDLTPRKATQEELEKILGKENIDPKKLYVITKGRDIDTSAEAYGLGSWEGTVYGVEKGNTPFNMASIRSERQYLKRQYPAEMPTNVDVVDEQFIDATGEDYIEGAARVVDEETGEIQQGTAAELEPETEPQKESEPQVAQTGTGDYSFLLRQCPEHGDPWKVNKFQKRFHNMPSGEFCNFSEKIKPIIEEVSRKAGLANAGEMNEWLKQNYDGKTWSKISEEEQVEVINRLNSQPVDHQESLELEPEDLPY